MYFGAQLKARRELEPWRSWDETKEWRIWSGRPEVGLRYRLSLGRRKDRKGKRSSGTNPRRAGRCSTGTS